MPQLNPYVRFNDGKCREAMTFYQECVGGGTLTFQTVGESPMASDMPPEAQNNIMHASLLKGGFELYASDMMRDTAVIGDNVALSVNCETEREVTELFSKFGKGGEVFIPLEEQFWGGIFGMLTDMYGVEWMFNYQKTPLRK